MTDLSAFSSVKKWPPRHPERLLDAFCGAGEIGGTAEFGEVNRVSEAFFARPAVQRGATIPARPIDTAK
jgi:hypothetical protein